MAEDDEADRLEIRIVAAEGLSLVQGEMPTTMVSIECGPERRNTEVVIQSDRPTFEPRLYVISNITDRGVEVCAHVLTPCPTLCPPSSH